MKKLNLKGHLVLVDAQKTKELYESLPLVSDKEHCGCDDCSFYAAVIIHISPAIQQFFQQFGVDPRKEGEIWKAAEYDDGTRLYIVDYRFIGKIEDADQLGLIEIDEAKFGLTNYPGSLSPKFVAPIIQLSGDILIRPEMTKALEIQD